MKALKTLTAAAMVMTVGMGSAMAQENTPTISMKDAIDISTGAAPGTLTGIALEDTKDGTQYVAILMSDRSESMLVIDGDTGEVIFKETAEASSAEVFKDFAEDDLDDGMLELAKLADLKEGDPVSFEQMMMLMDLNMAQHECDLINDMLDSAHPADLPEGAVDAAKE